MNTRSSALAWAAKAPLRLTSPLIATLLGGGALVSRLAAASSRARTSAPSIALASSEPAASCGNRRSQWRTTAA